MDKRKETSAIVVHCSATRINQDITAEDIKRWHMMERGFFDIGYHFVIERDGKLIAGRPVDEWGAHVKGHNHDTVGVCLIGGLDQHNQPENNFTAAQFQQLRFVLAGLHALYPNAEVKGHHYFNSDKDCPCFDLPDWLRNACL